MEIRLLSDPQYAEEFDVAVDDIIDRYVAGGFEGDELDRVRNYFFKSTQRQEKLRFALALKERRSSKKDRGTVTKLRPVEPRKWAPKSSSMRYLPIAASILLVASIGLIGFRAYRSRPDNEGIDALQAAFREERPTEGRISDFTYAPAPNQQRGTPAKPDYVQRDLASTLLLKAVRDNPSAASHHNAAKYYLMIRQFDQAEQEFGIALSLDPNNAKIHNDFGTLLLEKGQQETLGQDNGKLFALYARGLEEVQKAIDLDGSLLEAHFNRALLFQLIKPSEQAKAAWNDYLQRDSSSPWADEARKNLNKLQLEQRGAANDNIQMFLKAQRDSDDRAAWKRISETYTSAGNEITNTLVDELLASDGDATATLAALGYVAKLERNQSDDQFTNDLVNYYQHALPAQKPVLTKARDHMRAGYSLFDKTRFRDAIREYTIAKSHYEKTSDRASRAFVEYRLAHCYVLLPNSKKARQAFSRLLTICEANKYRWLAAQCLFGLAHATADLTEYSEGIEYSGKALERFKQIGDISGILKCLVQLADFNQAVQHINPALGYLSKAWALATSTQSQPRDRWGILNQVGFSISSLQLHAAALFFQKEALSTALDMGNPLLISRSHNYIGAAYAAMRNYDEAVNEATRAFEIGRANSDDPSGVEIMATASQQLGDIYRQAGRCDEAIKNYDSSLELYQELNFYFHSYEVHKGKLHCFLTTSNNQAARDELALVLKLSEKNRSKITDESQRHSFFDAEQEVYDLAIAFESDIEKNFEKAWEYSEQSRARSLLDAVKRGEFQRSHGQSNLNLQVVEPSLVFAEIKNKMPPKAQIVQYAVLDNQLVIWVLSSTTINHAVVPISAQALTEKVTAFLDTVKQPPRAGDSFDRNRCLELYDSLITPVERYLDKSKVLLIVPDKVLHFLPYAALISPANSRYLLQDYDLATAPSATVFVDLSAAAEKKSHRPDQTILSIGNPRFNHDAFTSLGDLPASAYEARAVADLYPKPNRVVLVDETARETRITSEIKKADVAHFAMHFVQSNESETLSGFPLTPEKADANRSELSNGILQSYEISGLKLRRTWLVVLSACQTGIEKQYRGEGAVGAARPFFVAGVPTVVASLWAVDSDASAQLMINFHKNRLRSMTVPQALKQSQIEMISSENAIYHHPYYWAPFLTVGGFSS